MIMMLRTPRQFFASDYNKRMRAMLFCALFAAVLYPRAAHAQMDMASHAGMEMRDQLPPEKLPPPQKMTGIGNSHMEISSKPEAQMWFDQGLNLIHGYWDYESARAFEQSVRVDPDCAICYWGLYQAESFYHGLAQDYAAAVLQTAVKLKDHATEKERLFIEATAAPSEKQADLWRAIVQKYPEDIQARLFLSRRIYGNEALKLLEGIMKDDPNNAAAHHYYIHALEGNNPARALHSAEVLGSLAPNAGHMVHMPGHIFFLLGDYARAEQSFGASTAVDERYMAEQHVLPDDDWNYVHNLMYRIANLMEEGKLKDATALSAKITAARGQLPSTMYIHLQRDSISRIDPRLPVALRLADWQLVLERLQANPPATKYPVLSFLARQLTIFAEGMRALNSHDTQKAAQAAADFDAGIAAPPKAAPPPPRPAAGTPPQLQVMADAQLQPIQGMFAVMSLELRASVASAQGKATDAHDLFTKAQDAERNLGYAEPPRYIRPVGEAEAAAMMSASDWPDARAAFENALKERPKSGFALYGIALTSEKTGNREAALKEYAEFLSAWKDADPDLPQIRHAKAYIAN
jgi:hypothetical protein